MANFGREFSIIVFDKDLTILGETFFPDGEFVPSLFFVAKDGLYISNNHIKNPLFDEDRLVFKRFILHQEETGEQRKPEIKSLQETLDTPVLSDTTIYIQVNVYPEILNQEELDNEKRFKDWSGEEDRIVYSLVVEPDGSFSDVKLERSGAPELNEETLRLLKMAQFKAAQLEDGTIVRCKSMFMMRYP